MDKPTPKIIPARKVTVDDAVKEQLVKKNEATKKAFVPPEHLMHGAFRNNEQMRELQRELNKNKPKRTQRSSK